MTKYIFTESQIKNVINNIVKEKRSIISEQQLDNSNKFLVIVIQLFLNVTNHDNLTLDGILGSNTINSIKKYQQSHGLVSDGIWGPKTSQSVANNPQESKVFKQSLEHVKFTYSDKTQKILEKPMAPRPQRSPQKTANQSLPAPISQISHNTLAEDVLTEQEVEVKKIMSVQDFLNMKYPELKLKVDGVAGPETKKAIMKYQDLLKVYPVDGIWGPKTQEAMKRIPKDWEVFKKLVNNRLGYFDKLFGGKLR